MEVHIEDIEESLRKEEDKKLIDQIKGNVMRYLSFMYEIVDRIMPKHSLNINPEEVTFFLV